MPRNSIELALSASLPDRWPGNLSTDVLVNADRPSGLCTDLDCLDEGDHAVAVDKSGVAEVGSADGRVDVAEQIAESIAEAFGVTGRRERQAGGGCRHGIRVPDDGRHRSIGPTMENFVGPIDLPMKAA